MTPIQAIQQFSGPLPTQADLANYELNANRFMTEFPGVATAMNAAIASINTLAGAVNAFDALVNFKGAWSGLGSGNLSGYPAINLPASVSHSGSLWALTVSLADVAAHTPGVSSAWQLVRSASNQITHGAGTVADGITAALAGVRNKLLNATFSRNTRAVSGTVTLAANGRSHDCWRAGVSGCVYTFASVGGVVTITVVSGELIQEIAGSRIRGGAHTLSWSGTAQGKIGNGSFAASPITSTLTGGTNVKVTFGPGTIALPQLEEGLIPQVFDWRDLILEELLCSYYIRQEFVMIGNGNARSWISARSTSYIMRPETSIPPMAAVPLVSVPNNSSMQYFSSSGVWTNSTMSVSVYGLPESLRLYADMPSDSSGGAAVYVKRNAQSDVIALLSAEL